MTRVAFIPPSAAEFANIFDVSPIKIQRGGASSDIEIFKAPARSLKGGGLFSSLAGVVRKVLPFVAKAFVPAAVDMGQGVLKDLSKGRRNLKESLKKRGIKALKSGSRRLLSGGGRRRAKKKKKNTLKKKSMPCNRIKYDDVFGPI